MQEFMIGGNISGYFTHFTRKRNRPHAEVDYY